MGVIIKASSITITMINFEHMGNQREYIASGGFSQYLYVDHPDYSPRIMNGVQAKVIRYIGDGPKDHTGLPQYADTSDMYFRVGKDGTVTQGKVYVGRKQCIDFDWSHRHVNSDGESFPKGVVHVQIYEVDSKGESHRLSKRARYMNEAEITKYGPIILAFNPYVKFRP